MFKVGDRVWSYRYNKYMWVNEVTSSGCFLADDEKLLINYYHSNCEFHQTADDMFEELGFERDNDAPYGFISYSKILKNGDKHYVTFRLEEKQYVIGLMIPKVPNAFVDWADTQHHNAIHQKLIELGWVE